MPIGRYLFNFKTPVVFHLEHLDIVIEDKALLLLSWKFKHTYLLSIPCLKRKYRQRELAVVVKVPLHIEVITIRVSSIWRRRKFKVVLKKLKLNEEASQLIIQQFKPLKMLGLEMPEIAIKTQHPVTKTPVPCLKKLNLNLRSISIKPHTEKFIYPH